MADITITATGVVAETDAIVVDGTAGGTITAGMPLYIDSANNNVLKPADGNVTAAEAAVVGIALHGASSGQPIKYQTRGQIKINATLTVGQIYVLSTNAGNIAPVSDLTTGTYTTIIGVAIDADSFKLNIFASGVQKA